MRYAAWLGILCAVALTGCPSPYKLGFPGPLPTAWYYAEFEEGIEVTVYHPATAPPPQGLPVVIFSAGFNQPRATYNGYAEQLAQWGYVAVIRSYPSLGLIEIGWPFLNEHIAQNSRILDWLALVNERQGSPLYGMVDVERAATTGHSLGAGVCIGAAIADPRVKAVVPLDMTWDSPDFELRHDLADVQAAILYIGATEGGYCSKPVLASNRLFDFTRPPTQEVRIVGADHMDFEDTPLGLSYMGNLFCPSGSADPQDVRDIASRYMIAWFNYHLKGLEEFQTYFNGAESRKDVDAGLVTIRVKEAGDE